MSKKIYIIILILIVIIALIFIKNRINAKKDSKEDINQELSSEVEFIKKDISDGEYEVYVNGEYVTNTDESMLEIYKNNPNYNPAF